MKTTCLFIGILLMAPFALSCQEHKLPPELEVKLAKGQTGVSAVLSDPAYLPLHSQTAFRQLIKKYAKSGRLKIVTDQEPGRKILVKGVIEQKDGKPLADALVYFYHTSDKGWYSDTAAHILEREGDPGHARLFGYLKTDSRGQFEFETIQARGYPRSDFPAHIHIRAWKNNETITGLPNELQFDDDPRLTPERKTRSLRDGNLIEKNTGTDHNPVYSYKIKLRQE